MRFGLLLNTQFPQGESASQRLQGLLDQVRAARDNGLDSVWVSQHYLASPFQMLQQVSLLILGTPDECRANIDRHARLLGVHHFIFRVQWPGMPQEDAMKQIELLGDDVVACSKR